MTKQALFDKLRAGEAIQHTLFTPILMHFAARNIGKTYGEFASDYKVLVEANMRAIEEFDADMAWLISDPYRETAAFGANIQYVDEGVPRCLNHVIKDASDVETLTIPDVFKSERTLDRIRGGEALAKRLQGTVPIIGWIEGPLAEACDLAGVSEMLMMTMMDYDASSLLMDKCVEMAKIFAKAQVEAGCQIIGMGDAVCSQIDLGTYDMYVRDRHKEIISYIHEIGGLVKLHICGNITHLLPSIHEIQADIVDLDWQVSFEEARMQLGDKPILCGNINPVLVQDKSAEEVFNMSKDLINNQAGSKFILSAGCEITVNTPKANLMAMHRASKMNLI